MIVPRNAAEVAYEESGLRWALFVGVSVAAASTVDFPDHPLRQPRAVGFIGECERFSFWSDLGVGRRLSFFASVEVDEGFDEFAVAEFVEDGELADGLILCRRVFGGFDRRERYLDLSCLRDGVSVACEDSGPLSQFCDEFHDISVEFVEGRPVQCRPRGSDVGHAVLLVELGVCVFG